ncbi:MAG: XdhC/CoxI family protein [Thermodesulfobacteriota bacterium]
MDIVARIVDLLERGETFCLVTVVVSANPDIPTGRKAIVLRDGSMEGGTGSAQLDSTLCALALEGGRENKRRTVDIDDQVRAFFDVLSGEAKLLVCGAGHIALPLAYFARKVGFRVTVLDDRSDFAHPSRFPDCEVIAEDFIVALRNMPLSHSTYVVVITRGHEHDAECLAEILRKETAYVGLIGSRRRVRFVLDMLGKEGIPTERLKEVFTPIGFPIGAESPEEIALSIVAELVCIRRKGHTQARALRAIAGGSG